MLFDQIKTDLIDALKKGEALRVSTLRLLLSEVNYKKIDVQRELTDEDVIVVIQKEAKKRREAIESYILGNRPEQAESEKKEQEILQSYLAQ